ncbi:MAG: phosphoribosyl-AMP cyclohydrolase [Actinobacteria bacterium]|uniref:Histidine biosynthesis bifunctional protein HisIE n=1 Tax=freshwater metagenome TaxID=449393 RepID=A0A6J7SPT9_9ZZZZ|nr:phosphoribosyl-AMP cyclohydrolase [Actinomycetota bacterium]MSY26921.1 phosphoribosyl-AMP cyclohydrolase [Actinomycetota bacterium]MSZ87550.1 phosphoribosyl-AMP cyclohydrolase [Actinomycetota bacterium]MTB13595.1 phosphoribosyl-AMP cyclohydrolase [Actinomycetota bacterium]MTB25943.1 phosphoribosyl-AMP cyclohydrolase [Actinomycetota bacterium]
MADFDLSTAEIRWNSEGLVPAIVQDVTSGEVLMLAWVNATALELTQTQGLATYWSRSRGEIWTKGATSGNVQQVVRISLDCDGDTLLYQVEQKGAACHTGERTCFTGRSDRP